jgi:NADPH-dependent glutamate synthase beta subunit-like oxidoreductase
MGVNTIFKKHYVAIIGGSISGSEAANILAKNGFRVVVFDMNTLPYGKIEDGLPKWHIKLRDRQINEIDSKLDHDNIRFVPNTKIGKDIDFLDLVNNWGFSAIILANGAWEDRVFPILGIDKFLNNGLVYQNSFIYWFNHKHEKNYEGPNYTIKNNTIVVGGGLASLDVVKIVMIEIVKKQLLLKKGIDVDLFTLEKEGIDSVLEKLNIDFKELEIVKAKLIYRRTAKDMPLKSPKDDSRVSIEIAEKVSEKLLNKYQEKYLFEFVPLCIPVDFVEHDNKLTEVVFQKVQVENGKIKPIKNSFLTIKTEMIISSIGSVPEKIKSLQYEYSSLKMREEADYHVFGFNNVFAIGNAVTGRGNIQESKKHGQQMIEKIIDKHLTEEAFEQWLTNHNTQIRTKVAEQLDSIVQEISDAKIQPEFIIQEIINKTDVIHKKIGYTNYSSWTHKNMPVRLEEILNK